MMLKVAVAVGAVAFALLDANPSLWIYDKLTPSNAFFENKNVWITGASSGIGAELAVQLSEAGANVVISARRENEVSMLIERPLHARHDNGSGQRAAIIISAETSNPKSSSAARGRQGQVQGRVER